MISETNCKNDFSSIYFRLVLSRWAYSVQQVLLFREEWRGRLSEWQDHKKRHRGGLWHSLTILPIATYRYIRTKKGREKNSITAVQTSSISLSIQTFFEHFWSRPGDITFQLYILECILQWFEIRGVKNTAREEEWTMSLSREYFMHLKVSFFVCV